MKKILFIIIFIIFIIPLPLQAACPACTFGLGAGIGLLILLGYDVLFIGLILGAFVILFIKWLKTILSPKKIKFKNFYIAVFAYLVFISVLYMLKLSGYLFQQENSFNILLFSFFMGSAFFYAFSEIFQYWQKSFLQKKLSNGKSLLLLGGLIVMSFVFFNLMSSLTKMMF